MLRGVHPEPPCAGIPRFARNDRRRVQHDGEGKSVHDGESESVYEIGSRPLPQLGVMTAEVRRPPSAINDGRRLAGRGRFRRVRVQCFGQRLPSQKRAAQTGGIIAHQGQRLQRRRDARRRRPARAKPARHLARQAESVLTRHRAECVGRDRSGGDADGAAAPAKPGPRQHFPSRLMGHGNSHFNFIAALRILAPPNYFSQFKAAAVARMARVVEQNLVVDAGTDGLTPTARGGGRGAPRRKALRCPSGRCKPQSSPAPCRIFPDASSRADSNGGRP